MSNLRPVLAQFAEAMESKLKANDHKPGWKNDSAWALLDRLREETEELAGAIARGASPEEIRAEAADVANFAMMVADVCGALEEAPGARTSSIRYVVNPELAKQPLPERPPIPVGPMHEGGWNRRCHPYCPACLDELVTKTKEGSLGPQPRLAAAGSSPARAPCLFTAPVGYAGAIGDSLSARGTTAGLRGVR